MSYDEPVHIETRVSGIWQTNSVVIAAAGEALVVDPAFFPRELEELSALVRHLVPVHVGRATQLNVEDVGRPVGVAIEEGIQPQYEGEVIAITIRPAAGAVQREQA